jgi:hypothetical protein
LRDYRGLSSDTVVLARRGFRKQRDERNAEQGPE